MTDTPKREEDSKPAETPPDEESAQMIELERRERAKDKKL